MPEKITYYAVIGGNRTIDNPYGLVRRLQQTMARQTKASVETLAGNLLP